MSRSLQVFEPSIRHRGKAQFQDFEFRHRLNVDEARILYLVCPKRKLSKVDQARKVLHSNVGDLGHAEIEHFKFLKILEVDHARIGHAGPPEQQLPEPRKPLNMLESRICD